MCSVCDAHAVLQAHREGRAVAFSWNDGPAGLSLEVEGEAENAEFSPGKLRFRRGEEGQWTDWTDWVPTNDLAGSLSRIGTDIKWPFVPHATKEWFTTGDFEPVRERLTRPLSQPSPADKPKKGKARAKAKRPQTK